jgi:hypothetical protein
MRDDDARRALNERFKEAIGATNLRQRERDERFAAEAARPLNATLSTGRWGEENDE